jgi:hypothetical protein
VLALCFVIGVAWLVIGVGDWLDRNDVLGRGATANAEILDYTPGGRWTSDRARVRFTTDDGEEVGADVAGPPTEPQPRAGGRLLIRYDPRDPGHAVPVDGSQAIGTYVLYIIAGVVMVVMTVYGIWWWSHEWWRERRPKTTLVLPRLPRPLPAPPPRPRRARRSRRRRR